MDKTFNKILDTKKDSLDNVIRGLKQFENNSVLNITLVQNSIPVNLTECIVRFNFLKPDKEVLLYMGDIINPEEGKIQLKLSTQLLEKIGAIQCDISVFDSLLMKITSTSCILQVEESIYSNDYYLNKDDFDIVQNMHIEEKKRLENEKIRLGNEEKRIVNESNRIKNEDIRKDNESIRNKDEDTRENNENTRINNESDRNASEVIRKGNEDKRINNENERTKDENNRNISEQNRINKEIERITNETARGKNEEVRTNNETERTTSEDKRIDNENERIKDEDVRKSNEDKRIENESERTKDEDVRKGNEDKRIENESERNTNENTRMEKWQNIEETFKKNAPGDMKKITYDTNNSGVVDKAETVPWEGIEGKPESIVESVNGKTGEVVLDAVAIKTEDDKNLEEFKKETIKFKEDTKYQMSDMSKNINSIINKKRADITYYVDNVNGSDNNDGLGELTAFKTIEKAWEMIPLIVKGTYSIKVINDFPHHRVIIRNKIIFGRIILCSNKDKVNICSLSIDNIFSVKKGLIIKEFNIGQIDINSVKTFVLTSCIFNANGFKAVQSAIVCNNSNGIVLDNTISDIYEIGLWLRDSSYVVTTNNYGTTKEYGMLSYEGSVIVKESTAQFEGKIANENTFCGGIIR